MSDIPFMDKLNEELREEERILKFHSATLLKKNLLRIVFLIDGYVYQRMVNDEFKEKISKKVKDILPEDIFFKLEFKKILISSEAVISCINEYLYSNLPSVFSYLSDKTPEVSLSGNEIKVKIPMEGYMADYCDKAELVDKLKERLNQNFIEEAFIEYNVIPDRENEALVLKTRRPKSDEDIKLVDIKITDTLIGSISKQPQYISSVGKITGEGIVLCGKITRRQERNYKNREGSFYIFNISDTTGTMVVKMFPRGKVSAACVQALEEGQTIVVEGNIEHDSYSNSNNMMARSAAKCIIDYNSITNDIKYKDVDEDYFTIKPKPFFEERQDSLFEGVDEQNRILTGKTYVVFDLETTGLEASSDEIIEIGAVKIVDGKITETFSTLINPQRKLNEEIIEKTHITDEMLEGQPLLKDVIGDFYKFTRDAILVAHNAPFDCGFISTHGQKYRYKFDNDYCDTLVMARQRLRLKRYKLAAVCEALNVPLVEAHRAMGDAMATAEAFKILLAKKLL